MQLAAVEVSDAGIMTDAAELDAGTFCIIAVLHLPEVCPVFQVRQLSLTVEILHHKICSPSDVAVLS